MIWLTFTTPASAMSRKMRLPNCSNDSPRLEEKNPPSRRVVDLGCGTGILAQSVSTAGYNVLGFDVSDGMLALAAKRVPRAEFRRESFISADIPACLAVTAIGEVFNYVFDRRNRGRRLADVFDRVHEALCRADCFFSISRSRAASAVRGRKAVTARDPVGPACIPPRKTGGEGRSRGRSQPSGGWVKITAATARCTG